MCPMPASWSSSRPSALAWPSFTNCAAESAGAMVFCDPMVDPRGGAFTVGLGLLNAVTVVPHHDHWSDDASHRTRKMTPAGLVLAGIDERTALIRDGEDGLLVPEGDPVALADALERLLRDPALASRLGAAAIEAARTHYSRELMNRRYQDLLLALAAQPSPRG